MKSSLERSITGLSVTAETDAAGHQAAKPIRSFSVQRSAASGAFAVGLKVIGRENACDMISPLPLSMTDLVQPDTEAKSPIAVRFENSSFCSDSIEGSPLDVFNDAVTGNIVGTSYADANAHAVARQQLADYRVHTVKDAMNRTLRFMAAAAEIHNESGIDIPRLRAVLAAGEERVFERLFVDNDIIQIPFQPEHVHLRSHFASVPERDNHTDLSREEVNGAAEMRVISYICDEHGLTYYDASTIVRNYEQVLERSYVDYRTQYTLLIETTTPLQLSELDAVTALFPINFKALRPVVVSAGDATRDIPGAVG